MIKLGIVTMDNATSDAEHPFGAPARLRGIGRDMFNPKMG
jgi:hypothetical protein